MVAASLASVQTADLLLEVWSWWPGQQFAELWPLTLQQAWEQHSQQFFLRMDASLVILHGQQEQTHSGTQQQ